MIRYDHQVAYFERCVVRRSIGYEQCFYSENFITLMGKYNLAARI